LQHEDLEDDPGIGQLSTVLNLGTVAKDSEVIAREHQVILKLMEDQLHIKWETVHQIIHEGSGKEEDLCEVCSTQPYG
jgi:hypothetical protein